MMNAINMGLAILFLITGCGRTPTPNGEVTSDTPTDTTTVAQTATPTPTPTPTPQPVTVISFPFNTHDYVGICNALRAWVPATQTIQFPISINSLSNYSFESGGVFIINGSGVRSNAGNHTVDNGQCTWVVTNSQFVSVTP